MPAKPGTLHWEIRRRILARSGFLARRVWHRYPWRSPVHQATIDIARDAGLGDVIMCTPALRELKRLNPQSCIRFYTNFEDLLRGLPYVDEVHHYSQRPPGHIFVEYTDIVPSPVHIARLIGDRLGVAVQDVQPDCMVDQQAVASYREAWSGLPGPKVVVLRRASRFTPNKDWPDRSWADLVSRLCGFGSVIEVGTSEEGMGAFSGPTYRDLRGATSIKQLVAAVAAADIYVGPVSGPMHVAAAVGVPAVAIIGGYEHPVNSHYAGNTEFFTELPCSPCWLRTPCPFELRCLHAIASEQVELAVRQTWAGLQSARSDRARSGAAGKQAAE